MNKEKTMIAGLNNFIEVFRKNRKRKNRFSIYFLSFLIPLLLLIPSLVYSGIFPFGENTTLAVDLRNQYIGLYEAFRRGFSDPSVFLYSFTKSLGGNMTGSVAYYLFSPFHLLIFAFPRNLLPLAIEIAQLLKVGLSGLSFSVLLCKREHGRDWRVVLFSVFYALNSFAMANMLNIMWFDSIMLFPILILYLEKLFDGRSALPYLLLLAISILMNFYIGYMICLFLIPYSLWTLIRRAKPAGIKGTDWLRKQALSFARFGFASILAAGLTAWLLFPNLYSLFLSKVADTSTVLAGWIPADSPLDAIVHWIPASFDYDQVSNGFPNVYAGLLSAILMLYYFINRRVSLRERICSLLLSLFLIASMIIPKLNILWHGMQYPIWYNFRFSWLFIFFMLLIGFRGWMRLQAPSWKSAAFCLFFFGIFLGYEATHLGEEKYSFLTIYHIVAAAVLLSLLLYLLHGTLNPQSRIYRHAATILLLVAFSEISLNAAFYWGCFHYEGYDEFAFYDQTLQQALQNIRPEENEFWRIEKTFYHDSNDAMRFQYPGIAHFNSTLEVNTIDMISDLGFAITSNSVSATNPTKITDFLFGIRYYIEGKADENSIQPGISSLKMHTTRPDLKDWNPIAENEYTKIYENPNWTPLGMIAESTIREIPHTLRNPMDLQDDILNALDGVPQRTNYLIRQPMDGPKLENMKESSQAGNLTSYMPIHANEPAALVYTFSSTSPASYYLSISNTLRSGNSKVFFNEEQISNKRTDTVRSSQILNVSAASTSEREQSIRILMDEKKSFLQINNLSLFSLDEQALQKAARFQKENGLHITKMGNTHIVGEFTATENAPNLFFSIPYDKGWHAKLDGKEVPVLDVLDGYLFIQSGAGHHTVELTYHPPYLISGIVVSAVSLVAALIWTSAEWLDKKKGSENSI